MPRCMCSAAVLLCVLPTFAAAQGRSVGPVPPRPATTLAGYEKALTDLLGKNADDRLWDTSVPANRAQLIKEVEEITIEIQGLPIGPVVPRPPVTPKPKPVNPMPTKREWDDTVANLQGAVQRASKLSPDYQLPDDAARDLQQFMDGLARGRPD